MKCKHCGAEWTDGKIKNSFTQCPFCGEKMTMTTKTGNESNLTLADILKKMVNLYGEEILLNQGRSISVFKDLAPNLLKEEQILAIAQKLEIGSYFVDCPKSERENNIKKALHVMEGLVAEEARISIVKSFVIALDWDQTILQKCFAGDVYITKNDGNEDLSQINICRKKHHNINARKASSLAYNYRNKGNYVEALKYYRIAAEQGDINSQWELGEIYFWGKVGDIAIKRDFAEAAKWYHKIVESGVNNHLHHAHSRLGDIYWHGGPGVSKNEVEAVKWYRKVAEPDSIYHIFRQDAQLMMGIAYKEGSGVRQDYTEAVMWFTRAAQEGGSVSKNAIANLKELAAKGSQEAKNSLAQLNNRGFSVSRFWNDIFN